MTVPRFLVLVSLLVAAFYGLSLWMGSRRGDAKPGEGIAGWLGGVAPEKKVDDKSLTFTECVRRGEQIEVSGERAGVNIAADPEADAPRMLKIILPPDTMDVTIIYTPNPASADEAVVLSNKPQTIFNQGKIAELKQKGEPLERSVAAGPTGGQLAIMLPSPPQNSPAGTDRPFRFRIP